MFRPSLFVVLLALSCRGATPNLQGPAEDGGPSFWARGDGPIPDLPVCRQMYPVPFTPRSADVLILFDRSESMLTEFGTGTRYSTVAGLLTELVETYQEKLRFGFQAFPGDDGCGATTGCCTGPPVVPVALGNAGDVRQAIAATAPRGSTPTASALRRAREYFGGLEDGVPERYVLLATDGRPSCDLTGKLAEPDVLDADGIRVAGACHDALVEVDALVAAGVEVIVLGVGSNFLDAPGGQPACLEEIARKGRVGGAPPEDRPWYFSGDDREGLEEALQRMFGGTIHPSCTLLLNAPPPDPRQVAVYLDGHQVPRNRNYGWDYVSPDDTTQVHFYGDYCRRIHRFQVALIEVRYGCPPCVGDPRQCE